MAARGHGPPPDSHRKERFAGVFSARSIFSNVFVSAQEEERYIFGEETKELGLALKDPVESKKSPRHTLFKCLC